MRHQRWTGNDGPDDLDTSCASLSDEQFDSSSGEDSPRSSDGQTSQERRVEYHTKTSNEQRQRVSPAHESECDSDVMESPLEPRKRVFPRQPRTLSYASSANDLLRDFDSEPVRSATSLQTVASLSDILRECSPINSSSRKSLYLGDIAASDERRRGQGGVRGHCLMAVSPLAKDTKYKYEEGVDSCEQSLHVDPICHSIDSLNGYDSELESINYSCSTTDATGRNNSANMEQSKRPSQKLAIVHPITPLQRRPAKRVVNREEHNPTIIRSIAQSNSHSQPKIIVTEINQYSHDNQESIMINNANTGSAVIMNSDNTDTRSIEYPYTDLQYIATACEVKDKDNKSTGLRTPEPTESGYSTLENKPCTAEYSAALERERKEAELDDLIQGLLAQTRDLELSAKRPRSPFEDFKFQPLTSAPESCTGTERELPEIIITSPQSSSTDDSANSTGSTSGPERGGIRRNAPFRRSRSAINISQRNTDSRTESTKQLRQSVTSINLSATRQHQQSSNLFSEGEGTGLSMSDSCLEFDALCSMENLRQMPLEKQQQPQQSPSFCSVLANTSTPVSIGLQYGSGTAISLHSPLNHSSLSYQTNSAATFMKTPSKPRLSVMSPCTHKVMTSQPGLSSNIARCSCERSVCVISPLGERPCCIGQEASPMNFPGSNTPPQETSQSSGTPTSHDGSVQQAASDVRSIQSATYICYSPVTYNMSPFTSGYLPQHCAIDITQYLIQGSNSTNSGIFSPQSVMCDSDVYSNSSISNCGSPLQTKLYAQHLPNTPDVQSPSINQEQEQASHQYQASLPHSPPKFGQFLEVPKPVKRRTKMGTKVLSRNMIASAKPSADYFVRPEQRFSGHFGTSTLATSNQNIYTTQSSDDLYNQHTYHDISEATRESPSRVITLKQEHFSGKKQAVVRPQFPRQQKLSVRKRLLMTQTESNLERYHSQYYGLSQVIPCKTSDSETGSEADYEEILSEDDEIENEVEHENEVGLQTGTLRSPLSENTQLFKSYSVDTLHSEKTRSDIKSVDCKPVQDHHYENVPQLRSHESRQSNKAHATLQENSTRSLQQIKSRTSLRRRSSQHLTRHNSMYSINSDATEFMKRPLVKTGITTVVKGQGLGRRLKAMGRFLQKLRPQTNGPQTPTKATEKDAVQMRCEKVAQFMTKRASFTNFGVV